MDTPENPIEFINGDCISFLLRHPSEIDLTITSPPYNLGMNYDKYQDITQYQEYLEFSFDWLLACYLATKPGEDYA